MTPCLALATALLPAAPAPNAPPRTCLAAGAEVGGRAEHRWPEGGLDDQLRLTRGRAELGLAQGPASARMVWATVRSGGEDGYIGVYGEALVPAVQVAEARWTLRSVGLAVAAGLVDDPWVATHPMFWDLRALAPDLVEAAGWTAPSDVGASVAWTAPRSWVTAVARASTGEGTWRRERNEGQNIDGLLIVRPLAGAGAADALVVAAWVREGSQGLAAVRDHRAGLRVGHRGPWAVAGAEGVQAWGIAGDALRGPFALSAWAHTGPEVPLAAVIRRDRTDESPGGPGGARNAWLGALGVPVGRQPGAAPPARLMIGWESAKTDSDAQTIAGADAFSREHKVFLHLDTRLRVAADGVTLAIP